MSNANPQSQSVPPPTSPVRRKFVLCFDGTGNKFSGTESDSNILKIYRMLDRSDGDQFHYYQPGIGTYVATSSFGSQRKSVVGRLRSWYVKSMDSAVGTSFDEHVMSGYRVSGVLFLRSPFASASSLEQRPLMVQSSSI